MDNRNVRLTAVLAAVVAVLAVVALVVTTYLNNASSANVGAEQPAAETVDGEPAPAGPVEPSGTTEIPEGDDDHAEYEPDARTARAITDVAVRFLRAWATPGKPAARRQLIGPYATVYLTDQLTISADVRVVTGKPATKPEIVAATPYTAGVVTQWSDGQRLRCNLVLDTDGWKVSEILPDEPKTPPATPTPGSSPATPTSPTNGAP